MLLLILILVLIKLEIAQDYLTLVTNDKKKMQSLKSYLNIERICLVLSQHSCN